LILEEFVPCENCKGNGFVPDRPDDFPYTCKSCEGTKGKYTGKGVTRYVSYILPGTFGLKDGWVVLGISKSRV
jgi:DnaJ-class molecular chaperone